MDNTAPGLTLVVPLTAVPEALLCLPMGSREMCATWIRIYDIDFMRCLSLVSRCRTWVPPWCCPAPIVFSDRTADTHAAHVTETESCFQVRPGTQSTGSSRGVRLQRRQLPKRCPAMTEPGTGQTNIPKQPSRSSSHDSEPSEPQCSPF